MIYNSYEYLCANNTATMLMKQLPEMQGGKREADKR